MITLLPRRLSLLWKIVLSCSAAITLVFAVTGWIVVKSATRATTESIDHEVRVSFMAYQSLWKARADRLASVTSILSAMSDVRAAFGTGDEATIRDTAAELWSRVSDEDAIFFVTDPAGRVIASLGGGRAHQLPQDLPFVRDAAARFPAQISGFQARGGQLYHLSITPVYVQAGQGTALLNVLVAGYPIDYSVALRLKAATGGSEFLFAAGDRVVASTLPPDESNAVAAQLSSAPPIVRAGASDYAPLITPLVDFEGAPVGKLAILRSRDAADREIANLRRNISLLWLVSMLVGLALTYVTARRIVDPVKKLAGAAAKVAARNYDCEVPVESEDELGRLAATFNAMCISIREAREELIRSERIGVVGRLAASIVHDLRNPLAAIYGGAEILMDSRLSEAQVARLARNMYEASCRIHQMLQDLLDLGRGGSGRRERTDLREVVRRAADSLALAAEAKSIRIEVQIPEDLPADLDPRRMERVVANLIGNAIEAMPGGGEITVSARRDGAAALVTVRDTGPGIPADIRDRLFQPFATSHKGNGMGLGLALSRQAVLDHGGEMWAEPPAGPGACLMFRIPLAGAETPAAARA
ncbi:MAG TPA: ATP-binding protein [Bryobacteraceae bacterium]|jgi:signal transduction histidine kinase|nr:ATP-binding protein [Bryobacteraceae bacterium]